MVTLRDVVVPLNPNYNGEIFYHLRIASACIELLEFESSLPSQGPERADLGR